MASQIECKQVFKWSAILQLLYGDSPDLPARTMSAVCFSKKLNWSYEQEWRALTWRREEIG